jgi:hypothetical protein
MAIISDFSISSKEDHSLKVQFSCMSVHKIYFGQRTSWHARAQQAWSWARVRANTKNYSLVNQVHYLKIQIICGRHYYPESVKSEPNKPEPSKPDKPKPGKPMSGPGPTLKATVSCKPSTWSEYTNNSWKTLYKRHLCYRRHERCLLLPLCS